MKPDSVKAEFTDQLSKHATRSRASITTTVLYKFYSIE